MSLKNFILDLLHGKDMAIQTIDMICAINGKPRITYRLNKRRQPLGLPSLVLSLFHFSPEEFQLLPFIDVDKRWPLGSMSFLL
jgi:hypothetical protein